MKILLVHNTYQQRGGEDSVVANELALLNDAGHQAELVSTANDTISGFAMTIRAAAGAIYSSAGRRLVDDAIKRVRPDVVHVHNFFPLISPSVFHATAAAGIPSVWTLHNYRVTCANGLLFRDGRPCEDCIARPPLPAVMHRCYRGSLPGSAAVAASIGIHRSLSTWRKVDRFIALSEFARAKFIQAGLPEGRISVKPNSVPEPDAEARPAERGGFVYVGRLSVEKGVDMLIEAWRSVAAPLLIVGEGPDLPRLRAAASPNVSFAGWMERNEVSRALASASAAIVPSIWYENCPMSVIEAFAHGTPVLASNIGALGEMVQHGENGFHFAAGDPHDLARLANFLIDRPEQLARAGAGAQAEYEKRFAPARNLECLMDIYRETIASKAMMKAPGND